MWSGLRVEDWLLELPENCLAVLRFVLFLKIFNTCFLLLVPESQSETLLQTCQPPYIPDLPEPFFSVAVVPLVPGQDCQRVEPQDMWCS